MRAATLALIFVAQLLIGMPGVLASAVGQDSTTVYTVRSGDTLSSIAARFGTTYQAIMRANNLSDSLIVPGQRLAIPQGEDAAAGAVETVPALPAAETAYVVRAGDTLWSVAGRYGISVAELKRANGMAGSTIITGQILRIPAVESGATLAQVVPAEVTVAESPCGASYTVQRGDTLSAIAGACGTTVAALAAANGVGDGNVIRTGQVLALPVAETGAPAVAPASYTLWFPLPSVE
jgi:LysM repeat protein